MMPEPIRCDYCPRRTLALRLPDGRFEVRYKGRTIRGSGALELTCEDCGQVTFSLDRSMVGAV